MRKGLEQTFLQKRYINGNKHRKRCVMTLIIKHMQIKPTAVLPHIYIGYHQKTQKITSVGKKKEKLEFLHIVGGSVKRYSYCGKELDNSSKVKYSITIQHITSTSRYIPKRIENIRPH